MHLTAARLLIPALAVAELAVRAYAAPAVPPQLLLHVRETAGVARSGEVIRSGVPLPRSLNIASVDHLAIVDSAGIAAPAEFRVLARWNTGVAASTAPIQWLLVAFPATVAANATATYRLVLDGSVTNPSPTTPLRVTRNGDQITVDTGAAVFLVGADPKTLFDEVRRGSARLAASGAITAHLNDTDTTWSVLRGIRVEAAGPLSASVIVDGVYDLRPVGGGSIGSHRRYRFTAGSPTAVVEQTVSWEGSLCDPRGGDIVCGGQINAIRVGRIRDTLAATMSAPRQVSVIGAHDGTAMTAAIAAGQTAFVRQKLRATRSAAASFDIALPGATATGSIATGALVALSGTEGTLAIALDHMHRYEPQALRVLEDGSVGVDLADDSTWIGKRQGLFSTIGISALPPAPDRSTLDAALWAPLNHPLHAWPDPAWWAASDAVGEIPVGSLTHDFRRFPEALGGSDLLR